MADFSALKTAIQANIRTNANEEITGAILQEILLSMVTTMGDGAINGLVTALQEEVVARQNAVGGEATARQDADSALSGRINAEVAAREDADTLLQNAINGITTRLNEGYVYVGIATPSTNPGTPAGKVFYIALQAGTYTNFSSLAVTQGITILKYNGTAWSQEQLVGIDDKPTTESDKLVKSGGVKLSLSLFNNLVGSSVMQNKAWSGSDGKLYDYNGYSATEVFVYDENAIMSAIPYKAVFFDKDFNFLGQADCQTTFILSPYNDAYYIAFTFQTLYTEVFSYKNKLSSKVLDAKAITPTGATLINNFKGNLSVLGDSISTFDGVSPDEYSPYYPEGNVTDASLMYWSILAKEMAFSIDTINACGHSCVVSGMTDVPGFLERYNNLGNPRVIIVQGGTNDWNRNVPIGELALWKETANLDTTVFAQAYDKLIRLIKANYPTAYIITLTNKVISSAYNDVIRKVSSYHKVHACVHACYYSYSDGDQHIHPDTIGMQEIARSIINGLVLGEATYKQSSEIIQLSDDFRVNNMFREVFFVGSTATVARTYKLHTVYIAGSRVAINISDAENNIICSFNDYYILNDTDTEKAKRNSVLYLAEANSSGISGYALVDFNYISAVGQNEDIFFNPRIVTSLPANPGISSYLQNQKLYSTLISENDVLLKNIKELYIYKKDGTQIDVSSNFGLGNIYVTGSRRVINITLKDSGGTENYILDADSARGENLSASVIELKEKNSSGYGGYIVLEKDAYQYTETIYANYSFNNSIVLYKNANPIICSYLEENAANQPEVALRKEINGKVMSCVKSTVDDEIAKARQGTYVDANAQGFLPTNTAAQNVSAMNTLLASGGTIIVQQPGEYLVNDRMLIHSNTTILFASGVVIKMASDMSYVFINYAAFNFGTSGYDENIKVIGYHLDTNGFTCTGGISGLRGFLTFFHAKNVYVSDVNCYYYKAHWFFTHLCDWENIEICNVHVFGDKDCIHLGRGKNAFIHNCAICAVDDTIALNAWDFVDSNPETGNIENVRIDNIVELPHYFNTASEYPNTVGFSIRMLNGCWLDWTSGMTVQHSTRVVYNGKLFRVLNLVDATAVSTVAPASGTGSDGINWAQETSPAVLGCCVKNVYVSNFTTYQGKSEGAFCLSNGINEVNHKSWVQGATWIPNENLHFRNIECYGVVPTPFLIQEDVKDAVIADSILDNTKFSYGLLYFKDVFGLGSSAFSVPKINLVNNMHILNANGQFKLSAVNVSGRRDSANVFTTDEKYSRTVNSTVKTANTVVTEQDKIYVI